MIMAKIPQLLPLVLQLDSNAATNYYTLYQILSHLKAESSVYMTADEF